MNNETVVMELVRWHGKSGGAFAFALIFLPHFLHQGKKWDRDFEKQKKETYSTQRDANYDQ